MLQLLIYLARCRRVQRRVQRVIPRVMTRENPILPTTLLPYCYLRSFSTVLSGGPRGLPSGRTQEEIGFSPSRHTGCRAENRAFIIVVRWVL